VNGLELFVLGRRLMKIGEEAISRAGFQPLPTSVRSVLVDVFEHPDSSIGEITSRTGFPQSHVSASVAKLTRGGALEATVDPRDRRRTLVRPSPEIRRRATAQLSAAPIDGALAQALGRPGGQDVGAVVALLDQLAEMLRTEGIAAGRRLSGPERTQGFEAMYASTPPWDIGRPQPAFLALAHAGALGGRVLDAGCGTGEHTLMAAGVGLPATGIDVAPAAIAIAERKATERGLSARFLVADALDLVSMGEQFDTVLDSGLFHVFDDEERRRYVRALQAVVPPGGRYFMLCFSDKQPGELGPRRVSEQEIRASFAEGWSLDVLEPAWMSLTVDPSGAAAWLVAVTRT
jgi:ubiquinone/menaquinone biosynthesis C-methylase UbiE/DNA-binding MarR family transcriptional regulator